MNMLITPHPLAGNIDPVMSSKSQAHRLLICAALADSPTELSNVGFSADVEATVRCLRALGARWARRSKRTAARCGSSRFPSCKRVGCWTAAKAVPPCASCCR